MSHIQRLEELLTKSVIPDIKERLDEIFEEIAGNKEATQDAKEEIEELASEKDHDKQEEELGDILFALINYSRFYNLDPHQALHKTIQKFYKRFRYIELKTLNKVSEQDLDKLLLLWKEAKQEDNI